MLPLLSLCLSDLLRAGPTKCKAEQRTFETVDLDALNLLGS